MAQAFDTSFRRLWSKLRKDENVIGLGFGPKIVDGKLVSPRRLIIYLAGKDAPVPRDLDLDLEFDVRLPRLTNRRITVGERQHQCMPDYQWIFWSRIEALNKRQRALRRDMPARHRGKRRRKHGAKAAVSTHIVDGVFVIRDPSGSLITHASEQRTIDLIGAYGIFREQFGDDYDFVAFFIDEPSGLPDIGNGSTAIFTDVDGIGRPMINDRAAWSSTKLRLCSHLTWITLRSMLHEPAHLWCSYVQCRRTPDGNAEPLLHADFVGAPDQSGQHWGRFMDDGISCMDYDRCDWQDNHDGTFYRFNRQADEASPVRATRFGYCPLDLYLMGLFGPDEVPDWTMICDPTPLINDGNLGPYTPAPPGAFKLGVQNVIFEEGPRTPDHLNSPRVFHQAAIVITKDPDPNCAFVAYVAGKQAQHLKNFRRATRGRAVMDGSLLRSNFGDLYIKHTPADDGTPSNQGDFFNSPDLWIRNNPDGDAHFDSQAPLAGQDNWIYARVRNKGAKPYQNVTVNFYLTARPHLAVRYPDDWHPDGFIGSAAASVVPARSANADGRVIVKVRWPADRLPAATGAIASVLCEIIPMGTAPTALHAVWENPKLAQRLVSA